MGHYATVYGFIQVHHSFVEDMKKKISLYLEEREFFSDMIFGPHDNKQSGFSTFAIVGEVKESYYDEPEDFEAHLRKLLPVVPFANCQLNIVSEVRDDSNSIKLISSEDCNWSPQIFTPKRRKP